MPSTHLGSCLATLANTLAKGAAELVAPHGLLPIDYVILKSFLDKKQWTVTELAQVMPVKAPHISRVVNDLVDRGLIRRRRDRNDRRVVQLTLTAQGKALALELYRRVHSYETTLSRDVTEEELAAFASVTSKVMANYAALAQSKPA